MCVGIWQLILGCISLAIDVIMLPIGLLSFFADFIQWPAFRRAHDYLKKRLGRLYMRLKNILHATSFPVSYDFEEVTRGNAYVEDLLLVVNELFISKPCDIEEKVIGFNWTIISTNVQGDLRIYPRIRLCSYFKRSRNCWLKSDHGRVRVDANVSGSISLLEATVKVKFLNFLKVFNVSGNIPFIEAHVEFNFDGETLNDGRLTGLILTKMSGMNLWVVDAGRLNFLPNFIVNGFTKIFKEYMKAVLQKVIRTQLALSIANFQFPAEDTMLPTPEELTSENSSDHSPRAKEQVVEPRTPDSLDTLSYTSERLSFHSEQSVGSPSMVQKHTGSQTAEGPYSDEQIAKPLTPEGPHSDEQIAKPLTPEGPHSDEQIAKPCAPESPQPEEQIAKSRTPEFLFERAE